MKRLVMVLVVLFTAVTLFAGGKECELRSAKSVELTGTLVPAAAGQKAHFRVSNGGKDYTVCEQTKSDVLKLGSDGKATLRVKGKVVKCGDGEELMIENAKRI